MSNIDNLFKKRLNEILKKYDINDNIFLVFKGFSYKEIMYLSSLKNSLITDDIFINNILNLEKIDDDWIDTLSFLKSTTETVIGIYEQLLSIKDTLIKLKSKKIIIIENNITSPWCIPFLTSTSKELLYNYIKNESETRDSKTKLLSNYYCDIKNLHGSNYLLLPINIEEDFTSKINFWTNNSTFNYTENYPKNLVNVNSIDDWDLRYKLSIGENIKEYNIMLDTTNAINNNLSSIITILQNLNIPYIICKSNKSNTLKQYDTTEYKTILQSFWGKTANFRNLLFYKNPDNTRELINIPQDYIIAEIVEQCENSINNNKFSNIFITSPTGAGKSILFQIPAYYLAKKYNGVTIVVSPLIALMNDQVDKLVNDLEFNIAACINSSMSFEERISVIAKIHSGEKSLIYLAPELLLTMQLDSFLGNRKLNLLVIDEAHTVTSWGRDFRSDYWFLNSFISKSQKQCNTFPVLCLTATAVYSGENDIVNETINELGLDRTIVHIGNVKRDNITFDINVIENPDKSKKNEDLKKEMLINRLREYIQRKEKVLAYCPYRSQVDNIYCDLSKQERIAIRRYHSKIDPHERKLVEKEYKTGNAKGLISTKAFGMGIDVSDIVHVIHFAPTGTLADYIQEIGRIARNKDLSGVAHIDYFRSDIKYVRTLNGISEMRQYQLREMLKKISLLYQKKKKRNLLISSENFEYLFPANEVENKTKNGLLLLSKDLANKYSFPVLIVRPKPMLTNNYINIPYEIQDKILEKYGEFLKKVDGSNQHYLNNIKGNTSNTKVYSTGDTFLANMDKIWENFYSQYTFGMFKKIFFEEVYKHKKQEYRISPRICVKIMFTENYDFVVNKVAEIINAFINILAEYKKSSEKQFTANEIEKRLNDYFDERIISHEKFILFLDIFTEFVDPNANTSFSRSVTRILRKRKQSNKDETVYFVSNNNYFRLINWVKQKLSSCVPQKDNIFKSYYSVPQNSNIEIMPLLKILEILELARYEIKGGEKSEIFIRINDPSKLDTLSQGKYTNNVLQGIRQSHQKNQELLNAFFLTNMSNQERWDLIEEYFLGNEEFVNNRLSID